MVASIPNDIFQYSTYSALNAGFNQGQPRTADLTSHGTFGIGVYEDTSLLLLKDKRAFTLDQQTHKAYRSAPQALLSFAMVTQYEPTFRVKLSNATLDALDALVSSADFGPAKCVNTLMPFKLAGRFAGVEFESTPGPRGQGQSQRKDVDGMVFGFVVPAWMKGMSGPRVHAHFLDASEEFGGRVSDFSMEEDAVLSFAKCGRFHLGFPQGLEWEGMRL